MRSIKKSLGFGRLELHLEKNLFDTERFEALTPTFGCEKMDFF